MASRWLDMAHSPFMDLLVRKGAELRSQLRQGLKMPFTEVVELHSGDLQAMGQMPITFLRQVSAVCTYPPLLNDPALPSDVKQRARRILAGCAGSSIGCYGESGGIRTVRDTVAEYLEQRDGGIAANPENIYLINGTWHAMELIFQLLVEKGSSVKTGILAPVPSSPACWHAVTLQGGTVLPYQLDEEGGWTVRAEELRRVLEAGRGHCCPRALCVANPGSPTGHVLGRPCMEQIIRFAADEGLLLLANEGHPADVYGGSCQLLSFKKVLCEMGPEYSGAVEFVSINSISKGHIGESGARGCYMEVVNLDPAVQQCLSQMVSALHSCSLTAQVAIDVATRPPDPGHPSYPLFQAEKQESLRKLAVKAQLTEGMLNRVPGIRCAPINSGVYAFPRIELPARAREAAEAQDQPPDVWYCLRLLQATGYLVAPGDRFGQKDGTSHFRMTFALPVEELKLALEKIGEFHRQLTAESS